MKCAHGKLPDSVQGPNYSMDFHLNAFGLTDVPSSGQEPGATGSMDSLKPMPFEAGESGRQKLRRSSIVTDSLTGLHGAEYVSGLLDQ